MLHISISMVLLFLKIRNNKYIFIPSIFITYYALSYITVGKTYGLERIYAGKYETYGGYGNYY